MQKFIAKATTKTLTKGKMYTIIRKDQKGIFILNDEKLLEHFDKKQLSQNFDV